MRSRGRSCQDAADSMNAISNAPTLIKKSVDIFQVPTFSYDRFSKSSVETTGRIKGRSKNSFELLGLSRDKKNKAAMTISLASIFAGTLPGRMLNTQDRIMVLLRTAAGLALSIILSREAKRLTFPSLANLKISSSGCAE